METIGVVGLGTMGIGIALRLAQQGYQVIAWNRTPKDLPENGSGNVRIARQLSEVGAQSHVIFLCVADYSAVRDVIVGLELASVSLKPILLELGTLSPVQVRTLGDLVKPLNVSMLDVGMLGNHHHARAGELRFFVGGEQQVLEGIKAVLEAVSKQIVYIGAAGTGMAVKLALNLLMGIEMEALAEAITFGERCGIDRRILADALATSGYSSPVMSFKTKRFAQQDYDAPDFRLTLMAKDLTLFQETCQEMGVVAPAAASSLAVLREAVKQGLGDKDCVAIDSVLNAWSRVEQAES